MDVMTHTTLPYRTGILGCGSMGAALSRGIARLHPAGSLFSLEVYAKKQEQRKEMETIGVRCAASEVELAGKTDILILAVKPHQVFPVLEDVAVTFFAGDTGKKKILVSLAAGVPLAALEEAVGAGRAVARVMPNTLCSVGYGAFGVCSGKHVTEDQKKCMSKLFGALGSVTFFDEKNMNAFTALAGCGPGFLFHVMDSLVEAGVSVGLEREDSRNIAVSLMRGCGTWAAETGQNPTALREISTSPAGMTIAGLNHLDRMGVRGHLIDAVLAAWKQGRIMDRGDSTTS